MKKTVTVLLGAALCVAAASCAEGPQKRNDRMETKNSLTEQEKAAGILTAEVMWKMGRVGGSVLSPDGRTVLYTVTRYDMEQNKGTTDIWSVPAGGGKAVRVTDPGNNESSVQWSADGKKIYFLSDRTGSGQVWSAAPSGNNLAQVTDIEGGVEGFSVAPSGDRILYIKRVPVVKRSSSELYSDLGQSKAKIYDDLMERHWDYWDDGSYLHLFVADMAGRVTGGTDIMEGEPWDAPLAPYFDASEIAWNHAGTQLAYTCKKLTGTQYALSTDSDIYLYDVASGRTSNLTEGMPGYDKYPVFSPADSMIAFTSMERPGNESDKDRLFVMSLADGSKRYLTEGFDYNAGNVRWADDSTLLFLSPIRATIQLCSVSLSGGPVRVITSGAHDLNGGGRARRGRNDYARLAHRTVRRESVGRRDDAHHEYQRGDIRTYPNGESRGAMGGNDRRQADARLGRAAARFRSV